MTKRDVFASVPPSVDGNAQLRIPQREAYAAIADHYQQPGSDRSVSLVLPVGCGKSGLLDMAPFAVRSRRTLLIAPNLAIADQLLAELKSTSSKFFYRDRGVLPGPPYPEPAEIRGSSSNLDDLDAADIVVTNIQQVQGDTNRWLEGLSADFFDLILFDEGHHNVAATWDNLRTKFPDARVISMSATPVRADGRLMDGKLIYSYPIADAIRNGYVKRVTGHRLNPATLRYVRREGEEDIEVEVGLDEVRRLGEQDADFRRSIVSSTESLNTIVDASIAKLRELRDQSGIPNLKIIASALNMAHCHQIVEAYQARGQRVDFIHSEQSPSANAAVLNKLSAHELDVIVQVRKLGEGFDHPLLAVAAVFSIFASLSPFVQFVGRVMRVIPGYDPFSNANEASVVFHVGANITGVWQDFQHFAEADQEWLMKLVDEHIDPTRDAEEVDPFADLRQRPSLPQVTSQGDIAVEDFTLVDDPEIAAIFEIMGRKGIDVERLARLERLQPTRQDARRAKRTHLDENAKTKAMEVLARHGLSFGTHKLDTSHRQTDFEFVKSAIDRRINVGAGIGEAERDRLTDAQLDVALSELDDTVAAVERELFDAG